MEIAKKHTDMLSYLKECVVDSYQYFEGNYRTFAEYNKFVFDTALTGTDKTVLTALNKPEIEFNIIEAYISRLRGEFSKQEPAITTESDDGAQVDPQVIKAVENHIRHIIYEAQKNGTMFNTYTDTLGGGFSVWKIWTEYAHEMSFNQVIKWKRTFDPNLCGFDPLARDPHKADGAYCYEIFPIYKNEFKRKYPDVKVENLGGSNYLSSFNWQYNDGKKDVILVCDFYYKKKKKFKIVQLTDGQIMRMDAYKKFLEKWEQSGILQAPPEIKGKPRDTENEIIYRYRFVENQILEFVETDYKYLPLIFVDGNSVFVQEDMGGKTEQKTRPYAYHAKGIQKMINFAGQTICNEIENMIQHKFKVAKESLPDEPEYLSAYTNVQIANTLVYKAFNDNDPTQPVPPPQEIPRVGAPPELMQSFLNGSSLMQTILGAYDAALGINDNQLSGVAIVEGATQSNASAMPYVVNLMTSLTQLANIIVDLIPKYYITPRTLPIITPEGNRKYQRINDPNHPESIDLNYDSNAFKVKVEAGVSFGIQKSRALNQIIAMSQSSQIFSQFINAEGLDIILDNFEVRGVDALKERAQMFMQKQAQQQQMAMQQQQLAMQNNPAMINAQTNRLKTVNEIQMSQAQHNLELGKLSVEKQKADNDTVKATAQVQGQELDDMVKLDKADAERARAAVDLAMKTIDMRHRHINESTELAHRLTKEAIENIKE